MTVPASAELLLTRRYRRLLSCYPPDYRARRGEELVGTLLDTARPGQTVPSLIDGFDLVSHGLRERLREDATPGLAAGLALAAPVALALGTGLAVLLCLAAELDTTAVAEAGRRLGPFRTIAPVAYAAWLGAAVGNAFLRRAGHRQDLIVSAVLVTALLPVAAPVAGLIRPPLWVVASLALCGLVALAGSAAGRPVRVRRRVLAGALTAGVLAGALTAGAPAGLLLLLAPVGTTGLVVYYSSALRLAQFGAAVTLAAMAGAGIRARWRGLPARRWAWALVALAVPVAWMTTLTAGRPARMADPPTFGRLGQFLLAACAVLVAGAVLARHRPVTTGPPADRPPPGAPATVPGTATEALSGGGLAGGLAAACVAGLSGYLALAAMANGVDGAVWWVFLTWPLAAAGWLFLPVRWVRVLMAVAVAAQLSLPLWRVGTAPDLVVVLAALGAVALVDVAPRPPGRVRWGMPAGASGVLAILLVVGAYGQGWQVTRWNEVLRAGQLAFVPMLLPLAVGAGMGLIAWRRGSVVRGPCLVVASASGIAALFAPPAAAVVIAPVAVIGAAVALRAVHRPAAPRQPYQLAGVPAGELR
jgi:hypothetical protein